MFEHELTLFKDGAFVDDLWRAWKDSDEPQHAGYVHVPFETYLAHRADFADNTMPLGLLINPGDRVEDIAEDISRFASISIAFPAFTDGRGYSTARLLVERLGYQGELRAEGDILHDQIPLMRRCGFNALVVKNGATRKALELDALAGVSVYMQPVGASAEVPSGTRPFLRRAAN